MKNNNRSKNWVLFSIILNMIFVSAVLLTKGEFTTFLLWFAVYANVIIIGLYNKKTETNVDYLEPYYVVIVLFTLYMWTSALSEVESQGKFLPILPIYYQCTVIGIIGFMLGYNIQESRSKGYLKVVDSFRPIISYKKFYTILISLTFVFVLLNYQELLKILDLASIKSYTESAAENRIMRTSTSVVYEYLLQVAILFILGSIFMRSFIEKKFSILSNIVFGLYAVIGIMAGGKSIVIQFVTLLLIYYNYNVQPIKLKIIIPCFLLLLLFSTIFNHVRTTTNLTQMADNALVLYETDLRYLTPLANGELTGPPRTLMNIIRDIDKGHLEFSYGLTTYFPDLMSFIPKVIFPDRPMPGVERYMEIFHPGKLSLGLGEGYSMLTEGYWTFGFIGVFVGLFLYGNIVSFYYGLLKRNIENGVIVFVYAMAFFPLVTTASRTGLIGSLKGTAMMVLPFLFIIFLSRKK